jgi:DNA-binding response OmpR family regulator
MKKKSGESVRGELQPPNAPRPLRVLVAEDDRDGALTLMMVLREEGHETRAVHSGRSVMRAVTDFQPDVAIIDIQLPELSGWEVARQIRERFGKRPMLIGISGEYKKGVDKILSELIGFDHYLVKPYLISDVLRLIASLRQQHPSNPA